MSPLWRVCKAVLGLYLPWRFGHGKPFHAGLAWDAPPAPDAEHEASRRFLERSARLIPERAYVAAFLGRVFDRVRP